MKVTYIETQQRGAIMSILKIALLGPPEVDHRDHRLIFPDRKFLAPLAYLATEGGRQERQKITPLLSPRIAMTHGRTAFRITVPPFRHTFETEACSPRQAPPPLTH